MLAVGLLFPNNHYRQEVYLQLFNGDSRIASNMVSSDFAFNWKDKEGVTYIEVINYAYAHFIASSIVFSGANYSDWYIADYPKQATRMKKIVRDGYEVVMETLPHDPSNWREAFVKMLKQLKSYGWEIFKGK